MKFLTDRERQRFSILYGQIQTRASNPTQPLPWETHDRLQELTLLLMQIFTRLDHKEREL